MASLVSVYLDLICTLSLSLSSMREYCRRESQRVPFPSWPAIGLDKVSHVHRVVPVPTNVRLATAYIGIDIRHYNFIK